MFTYIGSQTHAYTGTLKIYEFEDKGKNTSAVVSLSEATTQIPIQSSRFEWKCLSQGQVDGILISCKKGDELVETKLFCVMKTASQDVRYFRFGRGGNFISMEAKCDRTPEKKVRKKLAGKKKLPVPNAANPEEKGLTEPSASGEQSEINEIKELKELVKDLKEIKGANKAPTSP
jgi:hypothetical protein